VTRSNKSQRSRAPFSFKNKLLSSGVSKSLNRLKEPLPRTVVARYIITSSPSYYNLLEDLKRQDEQRTTIILQATEDVEFELVARELNFQSNQDACPLYIINPDNLRIDYLEKLERKAAKEKVPIFCYVGRSDDLDEQSATDLKLFSQYLDNLRAPHARLILGHEIGSEDLQQLGVKEHLDVLLKQSTRLEIPNLAERAADIPIICQHTISQLRSMHPFLLVQRISSETEQYLIDQRGNYSYVKLVRILRNAVALCQRDTLTVEDIKNYGESDVTTQHLLETMADENYFPQEASVNF
jgi:transcriptional regulator of acetoin/glycerol metabolism